MKIHWRLETDEGEEIGFGHVEPEETRVKEGWQVLDRESRRFEGRGPTRAHAIAQCAAAHLQFWLQYVREKKKETREGEFEDAKEE